MKETIIFWLSLVVSCVVSFIVTYNLKADGMQLSVCILCGMMAGIGSVVLPTTAWCILQDIVRWYKHRNDVC